MLLLSSAARAATLPDPDTIAENIRKLGAHDVVETMGDDTLGAVYERIGAGGNKWVALAPILAPGTDAGSAEGLGIALATALPSNPVAVLRVIEPDDEGVRGINRVCGVPFIESEPGVDEAYVAKAIAAVDGVRAPQYRAIRAKCLKQLHQASDLLHRHPSKAR